MMEMPDILVSDILAFVDDYSPSEAAAALARLDSQLVEVICRMPSTSQQQAVRGLAYRLLKDALARRATGQQVCNEPLPDVPPCPELDMSTSSWSS